MLLKKRFYTVLTATECRFRERKIQSHKKQIGCVIYHDKTDDPIRGAFMEGAVAASKNAVSKKKASANNAEAKSENKTAKSQARGADSVIKSADSVIELSKDSELSKALDILPTMLQTKNSTDC